LEVRYTDQVIRDIIIHGLYDQDHQHDILGHENQAMTLEEVLTLLEAKETGRKTQAMIHGDTGGAGSRLSGYKNQHKSTNSS
jgi:hypothetical protein